MVRALALNDHDEDVLKSFLKGDVGSWISDGRRRWKLGSRGILGSAADMRSRRVGFGNGARNAMAKSRSPEGDDGVTIIAGSSAFSSTSGRDKSASIRVAHPIQYTCSKLATALLTERRRYQLVVEALRETVETWRACVARALHVNQTEWTTIGTGATHPCDA